MKLKGVYAKDETILDFHECLLNIENGVLYRIECKSLHSQPMELSFLQPENNSSFELHKMPSKSSLTPNSNYKIEYKNKNNAIIRIYLILNKWELFSLKWQKKEFDLQDKRLRLDAIKYLVGGIIGSVITLIFQPINQVVKREPETPPKQEIKKSLDIKKDTIEVINLDTLK
jgi:hypothetical protein